MPSMSLPEMKQLFHSVASNDAGLLTASGPVRNSSIGSRTELRPLQLADSTAASGFTGRLTDVQLAEAEGRWTMRPDVSQSTPLTRISTRNAGPATYVVNQSDDDLLVNGLMRPRDAVDLPTRRIQRGLRCLFFAGASPARVCQVMTNAYDYWQNQPGNYRQILAHGDGNGEYGAFFRCCAWDGLGGGPASLGTGGYNRPNYGNNMHQNFHRNRGYGGRPYGCGWAGYNRGRGNWQHQGHSQTPNTHYMNQQYHQQQRNFQGDDENATMRQQQGIRRGLIACETSSNPLSTNTCSRQGLASPSYEPMDDSEPVWLFWRSTTMALHKAKATRSS